MKLAILQNIFKQSLVPLSLAASFYVFSQPVLAETGKANTDTGLIEQRLQSMIGDDARFAKIDTTTIQGLYQVQLGMSVVYMSADGQFLLNGNLIDLKSNTNLTQQVHFELRRQVLAQMDESSMIIYPGDKNQPQSTITVFSDIDCPYCVKLHKEIPVLNQAGVTVRYLAYPRSGPNSESYFKAVSVWCSKQPNQAMDEAMAGVEPDKASCQHPIDQHMKFAAQVEVNGTPNILLDNGDLLPGYVPARKLIGMLRAQ